RGSERRTSRRRQIRTGARRCFRGRGGIGRGRGIRRRGLGAVGLSGRRSSRRRGIGAGHGLAGGGRVGGGWRGRGGIGAGAQSVSTVLGLGARGRDLLGRIGLGGRVGRGRPGWNGGQIGRGGAGVGSGLLLAVRRELGFRNAVVVAANKAGRIEIGHGLATGSSDRKRHGQRRHRQRTRVSFAHLSKCPYSTTLAQPTTGLPARARARAPTQPLPYTLARAAAPAWPVALTL